MDPFFMMVLLSWAWILAVIAASILYRKRSGKPVFPRAPDGAVFVEAWRSGQSLANLLTRLGGASNCLPVTVADGALTITPVFPFNLMFLPEIYGLEVTAPLADVTVESEKGGRLGKRIILAIRGPKPRRFALWVKDRDGFRVALEGRRPASALAQAGARPRRPGTGLRTIIFRLFALVWGLGALTVSVTGLREDLRFRSQGVAVTGRFTAPPGEDDASNRMGTVSYQVEGATYQLTSLRGSGLYRLGEADRLRYLPTDPGHAREDDYLGFDLLFAVLGGGMLTLGVTFGWIVRGFARAMNVCG